MRPTPRTILAISAVLIVGVAFVIANALSANAPGTTKTEGAKITYIISEAEAAATTDIPVRLLEGSDAAHESAHIFDALAGVQGAASATLDTETLVVSVAYDPAHLDPAEIQRTLAAAGYTRPTAADATPAEVSADGAAQSITISDNGSGLVPSIISARAGLPLTMTFGPGTECRTTVALPALGASAEIIDGGTIELAALEPGTYEIMCSGGGNEGVLIVQ
ncbi:MAG TPA: hypothetical protein DCP20_08520 [Coriobacteriia bacterium]|nr:MAG: hypothetical protein XD74_1550 [Actinobacteria bacterium 66_15]HAL30740.1 hypothetical protein [Coriobacteriia bacterium]